MNRNLQKLRTIAMLLLLIATSSLSMAQSVNMSRYITLTVKSGVNIKLDLTADADNTPIKIVSGSKEYNLTVGTNSTEIKNCQTDGTTMIIYGNIETFNSHYNGSNLTGLDASQNTNLTKLYCYHNQLTSLNISQNTNLTTLYCQENQLTSLDVSQNTNLKILCCYKNQLTSLNVSQNTNLTYIYCSANPLTSLDVSQNTKLTILYCQENQLTSLDVSQNTNLTDFYCYKNQLTSLDVSQNTNLTILCCYKNQLTNLDVSQNTNLTTLYCYGNPFSTEALNMLYCSLPYREASDNAVIKPCYNSDSDNHSNVLASSGGNAIAKNWAVQYYDNDSDIPTTGTYDCGSTGVSVTGVNIINPPTEIALNQTVKLNAKVQPANASNQNLTWSINNTTYATIDNEGNLTGKAEGSVTIIVTTEDGGHTATCEVTVTKTTGINDNSANNIKIHPTLVDNSFVIETSRVFETCEVWLSIYNQIGEKVKTIKLTSNKQFIDVSKLQSGVYFAKVGNEVIKFVKQ